MTLTDLLIPIIAFLLGIVAAYLFFRQQISSIEGRAFTASVSPKSQNKALNEPRFNSYDPLFDRKLLDIFTE
jgi:hypothetical protein